MLERKWNEGWKFWKKGDSFALLQSTPADAAEVTLPHDAMILEPPCGSSPNGSNTGYYDGGIYTYEKRFFVPEEQRGGVLFLKFEGVYMNAQVYLNGSLAAHRPYGYSGFTVPLHDWLVYGRENTLRVEVRNSAMSNSRWYSGSGIYRDVYLLSGRGVFLSPDSLQMETKAVEDGSAQVELRVKVKNRTTDLKRVEVRTEILDSESKAVAVSQLPLPVFSGKEELLRDRITIENVQLWSEDSPALYRARVTLLEGETVLDESEAEFGVRTLTVDAFHGLRVNGKEVKLRGACIHHDSGLLGAATYGEAQYRQVKKLKETGFNAIRMSHHPMAPAMLRACDRLGVYVMDETFDMWTRCKTDNDYALYFDKWWEEDVEAMVAKDYNHPCVLLYSMGNEIPEIGTDQGAAILRAMSEKAKSIDTTRFTTIGINGIFAAGHRLNELRSVISDSPEGAADGSVNTFLAAMDSHMDQLVTHQVISDTLAGASAAVDIPGYNYMTARYEKDRVENPNRVIVGSETYPPEIGRNWTIIKKCPNVIGDFTWTGWDYIGEAGVGVPMYQWGDGGFGAKYPCRLAYCGDLDITGFRRPASYYREIVFGLRTAPYISVQDPRHYGERVVLTPWVMSDSVASWTWPGLEGKPAVAEVYSAAPEVELVQDGKSLGRQPAGPEHRFLARFEVVYSPGALTAIAWDGDEELGRMELVTASAPELKVTEEPRSTDCGEGLHYYAIELADANGVINTAADCEIEITVKGGTLLGFGSGDPKAACACGSAVTRTWNGRAQAIVQAKGTPEITVTRK